MNISVETAYAILFGLTAILYVVEVIRNNKLKKELQYKNGELELLQHNYETLSHVYFDMVNSKGDEE